MIKKVLKKETITAVVPALNEEKDIRRCLGSLSWCDHIRVIWMGNDKTGEITRKMGAELIIRNRSAISNWPKVQENINWAIGTSTTDWVIRVDADEEVTPLLKEEILKILSSGVSNSAKEKPIAYGIPRYQYFFGGFLKGGDWAYDRLVRLFRRGCARYDHLVHNHEQFAVTGAVGYLAGRLNHYSHPTLTAAMEKFNSYTSTEILDHTESRSKAFYNLLTQPGYIFWRWLIWHRGYRDGLRGFIAAAYRAFYEFMLWSKYLEMLQSRPPIPIHENKD